jgi:hypothetical protein
MLVITFVQSIRAQPHSADIVPEHFNDTAKWTMAAIAGRHERIDFDVDASRTYGSGVRGFPFLRAFDD